MCGTKPRFHESDLSQAVQSFREEAVGAFHLRVPAQAWDPLPELARYYFLRAGIAKTAPQYADSAGVYIYHDDRGHGIYVGHSHAAMGARVLSRLGPMDVNGAYTRLAPEIKGAEYVVCLPFDRAPFQANAWLFTEAFEQYLLNEYCFPGNP